MKTLVTVSVVLGLLFSAILSTHAQRRLPLSHSISVTLDGLISLKEWNHAQKIEFEGACSLYVMADTEWLYLATPCHEQKSPYTDLYFKTATGLFNLHASMQLGERILPDDHSWDDEKPAWNWGNNEKWTANTVRFKPGASDDLHFHEQIEDYQGQEFRISRNKLGSEFSLFVLIRDFIRPEVHQSFPLNGTANAPGTWMEISLEG